MSSDKITNYELQVTDYDPKKKFENKYGYFSEDGREFVITRPDTPRPWINVISNGDYGITISQTGSGYSWRGNSQFSRITRWYQDLIRDDWGKYIYIKDRASGEYWSCGYKPVCKKPEFYEVRHGVGYSSITNLYSSIRSTMTAFVAKDEPVEIWKLTLKNEGASKRDLSLFTYLEWCLGNHMDNHREFHRCFISTEYDDALGAIFSAKRRQVVPDFISTGLSELPCYAFHSASIKPSAFETNKENFIGMYGSLVNPKALEDGGLKNGHGKWVDAVGSLRVDVELAPQEEKSVVFVIGESKDRKESGDIINKYKKVSAADKELAAVKAYWNGLLGKLSVETPDEAFNFMTNTWLKYQAISGRLFGRSAYYQEGGAFGFRDQLQDSQIYLALKPELTKKQILLHAEHQFKDGTVYHWWHPVSETGSRTGMTDDLLWLSFVLLNYMDETGDFSVLNEKVKFADGGSASIYEHSSRAIDKALSRFSKRGLPLIGEGDWNDGMNLVGVKWKGESVWLGHFLYNILIRWTEAIGSKWKIPPTRRRRLMGRIRSYSKRAERLKESINNNAWDGSWYIRATKDDGSPLGSSHCEEGKIFLNAQTWAVISGSASDGRGDVAMSNAEKILNRDFGPLLFTPAYSVLDDKIGYLSRYAPGVRENGGVYTHASCWAIWAECILKNADVAYDIYSKLCPVNRTKDIDKYKAEPYVTAGNSDGPESPLFGQGGWTWYSGSAAWLYKVSIDCILGVKVTVDGLLIDPCIPKGWKGFKIRRPFRSSVVNIEVENPQGRSHGVKEIYVDGKRREPGIIEPFSDTKSHNIRVIL